ncbi:hypothetical protein BHM03_00001004, partial [Ensete ventricosum]
KQNTGLHLRKESRKGPQVKQTIAAQSYSREEESTETHFKFYSLPPLLLQLKSAKTSLVPPVKGTSSSGTCFFLLFPVEK